MTILMDLLAQHENVTLEVKSAQGRNGRGDVPQDMWKTYVAMANTYGGTILLGIKEEADHHYTVLGLGEPHRVQKQIWDQLNDRQVVNANVLQERDIECIDYEGKTLIVIRVPQAKRDERPVYIGRNPLAGTYRRNFEGDYLCTEATVRRMLAEATLITRDDEILKGFTLQDLDQDSLAAYRNEFRSAKPGHPWTTLDDVELLRCIGGWRRDRETNEEGITLAGLLMFGRLRPILDAVSNYIVDYRELGRDLQDVRWIDRLTTDGTWSGNLFDFYHRVYLKLTADIKVPFRLEHGKRIDETPVHEALREALVNALIHADYHGRVGISIIKKHDSYTFSNPGDLRLPIETIYAGGTSDCRNRNLQKMFQMIGVSEQAGSGVPKIRQAWNTEHRLRPLVQEQLNGEQTEWILPTISLLSPAILNDLGERFGDSFQLLTADERLALATAATEGRVTNNRMQELTLVHRYDLTDLFRRLVAHNFLAQHGVGRGTYYILIGSDTVSFKPISLFDSANLTPTNSEHLTEGSEHLTEGSEHLTEGSEHLEDADKFGLNFAKEELAIIQRVTNSGKTQGEYVRSAILLVCRGNFLTLNQLSHILKRTPDTLRTHYIASLVQTGELALRFPDKLNHPEQGYKAK